MSHVQVGDVVESYDPETAQGVWSPVISFLHRDPQKAAEYLQIECVCPQTKEKKCLAISAEHMVFVPAKGGCPEAVPAGTLRVGDFVEQGGVGLGKRPPTEVVRIGIVNLTGVYAPLTKTGCLVVDGILASCYVWTEHSHSTAHKAFAPLRWVYPVSKRLPPAIDPVAHKFGRVHWYAKMLSALA